MREKIDQVVVWKWRKLLPMMPTAISTRATETPKRIEITLATSAMPIQAAAINQTLSM